MQVFPDQQARPVILFVIRQDSGQRVDQRAGRGVAGHGGIGIAATIFGKQHPLERRSQAGIQPRALAKNVDRARRQVGRPRIGTISRAPFQRQALQQVLAHGMKRRFAMAFVTGKQTHFTACAAHVLRRHAGKQRFADARFATHHHGRRRLRHGQARPHAHQAVEFTHPAEHAMHRRGLKLRLKQAQLAPMPLFAAHGELIHQAFTHRRTDQYLAGLGKVAQPHGLLGDERAAIRPLVRVHQRDIGVQAHADTHARRQHQLADGARQPGSGVRGPLGQHRMAENNRHVAGQAKQHLPALFARQVLQVPARHLHALQRLLGLQGGVVGGYGHRQHRQRTVLPLLGQHRSAQLGGRHDVFHERAGFVRGLGVEAITHQAHAVLEGQHCGIAIAAVQQQAYQLAMRAFIFRMRLHPQLGMLQRLGLPALLAQAGQQGLAAFRDLALDTRLPTGVPTAEGSAFGQVGIFQQPASVIGQALFQAKRLVAGTAGNGQNVHHDDLGIERQGAVRARPHVRHVFEQTPQHEQGVPEVGTPIAQFIRPQHVGQIRPCIWLALRKREQCEQ
ncbi:hypothetical protein D3C72_969040 [compost metagenome]